MTALFTEACLFPEWSLDPVSGIFPVWRRGNLCLGKNCWDRHTWHVERPGGWSYPRGRRWRISWTLLEAIAFVEALRAGNRYWARLLLKGGAA